MIRLLVILVLALLIYWLLRRFVVAVGLGFKEGDRGQGRPSDRGGDVSRLVRCPGCGVHLPDERALQHGGFCSADCRRSGRR